MVIVGVVLVIRHKDVKPTVCPIAPISQALVLERLRLTLPTGWWYREGFNPYTDSGWIDMNPTDMGTEAYAKVPDFQISVDQETSRSLAERKREIDDDFVDTRIKDIDSGFIFEGTVTFTKPLFNRPYKAGDKVKTAVIDWGEAFYIFRGIVNNSEKEFDGILNSFTWDEKVFAKFAILDFEKCQAKTITYPLRCGTATVKIDGSTQKIFNGCEFEYESGSGEKYICRVPKSWKKMAFKEEEVGINFYSPGLSRTLIKDYCRSKSEGN